ncbi:uncharacterized protein AB675_12058 [Cyphellophora attinorum]|uniref:Uncharacterized protein n=1 Tax=Cyphellophora attinorum TaxID=1664694 RepID=A0A0N1NXN0_9EURO|nr:uncharacterized protein AB675_12058 [Phialophora attinorum]KPI38423.1 hypothetical protein AB675_12058 [Phialophora attinorum]
MSKYNRPPFFTSPYSNISPPATSFDMARSSSRDSTSSAPSFSCAYSSLAVSQPLSRSSSTASTYMPTSAPTSAPMRRSSSSSSSQTTWLASPYRSCLNSTSTEANSYLSDDDLLSLNIPVETIPSPMQPKRIADMNIEEQIAHLRNLQQQEDAQERQRRDSQKRKQVRFAQTTEKPRRPQLKQRSTTVRSGLSGLNGHH